MMNVKEIESWVGTNPPDCECEECQPDLSREKAILCYVKNNFAYFTTQSLEKQWGDDWDDAPYEHNAGEPYEMIELHKETYGIDSWEIIKVAFDGDFFTPAMRFGPNCPYSVQDINQLTIPWLLGNNVTIPAGTTLREFKKRIRKEGGKVYESE